MKAKIVITLNPFLYAQFSLSHVPQRKRAVGQTHLFIHSFNKHLSLIRGLLFPARDGSCLSGSRSIPQRRGPLVAGLRETSSPLERKDQARESLSDQHSDGGSAFTDSRKEKRGGREVLSNWGGSGGMTEMCLRRKNWGLLHLRRAVPLNRRPNWAPFSDSGLRAGWSFSPSKVFYVHTQRISRNDAANAPKSG